MSIRDELKGLCETITGKTSTGNTISEIVKDINNNYPDKITIDTNVAVTTDLFGKTIKDLQENVFIQGNKIYGKLKYITGYTGFSGNVAEQSGNYLVLHCTANNSSAITVEVVNGTSGPSTLDADGIIVCRIADKSTQSIEVKNGDKTIELSLAELVLEAPVNN